MFRLVNAEGTTILSQQEGLLLHNGATVCDDFFNITAANAVCRLMGFDFAVEWSNAEKWTIQNRWVNMFSVCINSILGICDINIVCLLLFYLGRQNFQLYFTQTETIATGDLLSASRYHPLVATRNGPVTADVHVYKKNTGVITRGTPHNLCGRTN